MNTKNYLLICLLFTTAILFGCKKPIIDDGGGEGGSGEEIITPIDFDEYFSLFKIDALRKILPQTDKFQEITGPVRVARGENATLELVIDAKQNLSNIKVSIASIKDENNKTLTAADTFIGRVLDVSCKHQYKPAAPDKLVSPTGKYPDPVVDDEAIVDVNSGEYLVYYIDIPISTKTDAGTYKCQLEVNCTAGEEAVKGITDFDIQVYPVTIEKQTLLVNQWLSGWPYVFMNNMQAVEEYSDLYWELKKILVEFAAKYGCNTFWLNSEPIGVSANAEGTDYVLDFTLFDKGFQFYVDNVKDLKQLHGEHFYTRGDWTAPFGYMGYVIENGVAVKKEFKYYAPELKTHIDRFFPKLQEHLRSKKLSDGRTWLDIYAQGVADEPVDENVESWNTVAQLVKAAAPDLKIVDAYRASTVKPELLDIPIPQLDELDRGVWYNLPEDNQLWFYTSMYPRGEYANRFIELPSVKNRVLHWINFKYNAKGYLHWAFANYDLLKDPFMEASVPSYDYPGGETFICYPGYKKLYPSLRLFNMREGIRDYELLRMIEATDPSYARKLAGKVVYTTSAYNTDITNFRKVRIDMLEYLSEHSN